MMMDNLQSFHIAIEGDRLKLQIESENLGAKYRWYLAMAAVEEIEKVYNKRVKTLEERESYLSQIVKNLRKMNDELKDENDKLREKPKKRLVKRNTYSQLILDYLKRHPGTSEESITAMDWNGCKRPDKVLHHLVKKRLVYKAVTGVGFDNRKYFPIEILQESTES